jgi:outer membrane protein OmpA-like peptidoglycan-associated protein
LYRVNIIGNDTYSVPENLGPTINTEGRETFPFVSEDNELYFATDGRPGLGGLDIYATKIDKNLNFKEVKNFGSPINGPNDDFAFFIDSKSRSGFFTSNRDGGRGYDDIYKFSEIPKLTCQQFLSGMISDQETGLFLPGSKLILFDEKFQIIKETVADEKGEYKFEVECGQKYYVRAQKQDYETKEANIIIPTVNGDSNLSVQLEKRIKLIGPGTDLAKILNIPIIYFDLDKAIIRNDAAFYLEKIIAFMNQYPKIKIDVRSHTDSRQSAKYNELLSDRRAQSTREWIIKNGIDPGRITAKGYGESQLVNQCSDDVKCTEEEHQANRRSEFIIVSME